MEFLRSYPNVSKVMSSLALIGKLDFRDVQRRQIDKSPEVQIRISRIMMRITQAVRDFDVIRCGP